MRAKSDNLSLVTKLAGTESIREPCLRSWIPKGQNPRDQGLGNCAVDTIIAAWVSIRITMVKPVRVADRTCPRLTGPQYRLLRLATHQNNQFGFDPGFLFHITPPFAKIMLISSVCQENPPKDIRLFTPLSFVSRREPPT